MNEVFSGRVAVIGLGYIGLPTAAVLGARGVDVVGVDVKESTVATINEGRTPFVEPDLAQVVAEAVASGHLTAAAQPPEADAYIIAVPTPTREDHTPDMSYVRAATEAIAPRLRGRGEVVILESTSPPGATSQIRDQLAALRPDLAAPRDDGEDAAYHVAHCPERVLPGRIMIEMLTNDRIVGGVTRACAERAASIYRVFCEGQIVLTDATSAEMAKLVENAYRDVNIAFANELSLVCDEVGLDVWEVIRLANHHPRVNVLQPGPGVGGHCIAVDPWFIVAAAPEVTPLIRMGRQVNDAKPHYVADRVVEAASHVDNVVVACLGLAFKADVDDLRESPSVEIVAELAARLPGRQVLVAEPYVEVLPPALARLDNVELGPVADVIARADVIALLVDHTEYRALDREVLAGKTVIDTRGTWRTSIA